MSSLDEIKQKKLQEMQQKAQEEAQLAQQIGQLETVVRSCMTKDAISRYGNIKAAHPELAMRALAVCGQLIERGTRTINDDMFKEVLIRLQPQKRDIKITRR